MRHRVLLGLTLLALAPELKAVRLESTRLAPEASVWFEPNHGQVGGRTEWTARASGAWLFLTSNEVVYALPPDVHFDPKKTRGVPTAKTTNVHMRIVGGRRVKGTGEKPLGGYSNYFLGKHENEWFSGVPHFGQVRFPEVYSGIDVVYYTTGRNVEYDFIVKPGADPSVIELAFSGETSLDEAGDLLVTAGGRSFRQRRPRVFQENREIEASYRINPNGTVKLDVGAFDPLFPLRVDPVLDFSTYLGGPGEDDIKDIAVGKDGNPVLVGATQSPASPALDPFQQPSIVSLAPIILKMSADGRRVISYTIFGRNGWDSANTVAVEADGSILVGGSTNSANFPLMRAFQAEISAAYWITFVTKLSADSRTLVYSSYLGGANFDQMKGVLIDRKGIAWYLLSTSSANFPTKNAIQSQFGGGYDAAVVRVAPNGELLSSTFFGGAHFQGFNAAAQAADGSVWIAGGSASEDIPLINAIQTNRTSRDGHYGSILVRMDENASKILYSSFIAGTTTGSATGISLDSQGTIWVGGFADDRGLPVVNPMEAQYTPGTTNGYLMRLDPAGQRLLYSTYLAAFGVIDLAVDSQDNIYLGGRAASPEIVQKDSLQSYLGGGILNCDHAVMKFAPEARALIYSTIIGGRGNEEYFHIATGGNGQVYGAGGTGSIDYPIKAAYQPQSGGGSDGFFFRLSDTSVPQLPAFTVSPSQLTFRFVQGDSIPAPQSFTITGAGGVLSASAVESWLRVNTSLSVSVNPAGLPPGTYQGAIVLTPPSGVAGKISVTLYILAKAPTLESVEPPRIAIGTDDTEITLRGSGFTSRTSVQLQSNLWQLTPIRFIDSTTIKLTLPKAYFSAEYNHSITVQNPDSAVSKPVSLAVGRPAPAIAAKGIVSAASYSGDVISPGEILTLFGENFEQGMRVNFDGLLATPLYITPGQLSVVAPTGLTGVREVNVIVEMNFDWRSIPVRIPVWPARPGLFTANSSGKGQAAALNQDGSVNSPANPAAKGSIAVLYGTGGGVENLPTKVFIDGIECEVLYAGQAPGLIAGAWQLNVRIPEFASKGEVVWRAGERESVEGVFVALKEN